MTLNFMTEAVTMVGDGIPFSPAAYAQLFRELTIKREIIVDSYCQGGVVEEFEKKAARVLGKEDALILPTGTLANSLAVIDLAGHGSRVIAPYDSHLHRDSGDAAQSMGGINLIPVKPDGLLGVDDIETVLASFAGEKVTVPVKALHLESPVRRLRDVAYPLDQFDRLTAFAQSKGWRLHLDGARLFVWSSWCGRSVASLAAPFDTVYVSLWKCFNSLFGAILAGSGEMIARLRHRRRREGGALAQIWPVALVADHFMSGFTERLATAKEKSIRILSELGLLKGVTIYAPPNSTNASLLSWDGISMENANQVKSSLLAANIQLPQFSRADGGFWIKVNETWNHMRTEDILNAFKTALSA